MSGTSSTGFPPPPPHGAPVATLQTWLAHSFGLPPGYITGAVERFGSAPDAPMTMEVIGPEGAATHKVRWAEQRDAQTARGLRSQASADTNGLTRADFISGPKAALAVYEVLCSLAAALEDAGEVEQVREWISRLRAAAVRVDHDDLDRGGGRYRGLKSIKSWKYDRETIRAHAADRASGRADAGTRPRPLVLHVERGEHVGDWISCSHLGLFLRYEMGAERMTDARAAALIVEAGGHREEFQAWNDGRTDKATRVLVRLPDQRDTNEDEQ